MTRVVIFGDSNEDYFGPATRDWCVARLKLAAGEIELATHGGTFIEWCPGQAHWPAIAADLGPDTRLVVIGLGGNMVSTSARHKAAIPTLVAAIAERAPNARLVWRGPPPATAMRIKSAGGGVTTTIAGLKLKSQRYRKNREIRQILAGLGFTVFDAVTARVANSSRIYVDVLRLHAGGPCPTPGGPVSLALGTPACLAYEQQAIEFGGPPLAGEQPAAGTWSTFSASPDHYGVHVGAEAAVDLVHNLCGPAGVYG